MHKIYGILGTSLLALGITLPAVAADHPVKKGKRVSEFSELWQSYEDFKNNLNKNYGFDYGLTYSLLGQYGDPSGKKSRLSIHCLS